MDHEIDVTTENSSAVFYSANGEFKKAMAPEFYPDIRTVGWDNLDASLMGKIERIFVHPRSFVVLFADKNYRGESTTLRGEEGPMFENMYKIGSVQIRDVVPLDKWISACCKNSSVYSNVTDQLCGKYWEGSIAACGYANCSGTVSSGYDATPQIMHDHNCKEWCKKNPNACDVIKLKFCKDHMGSKYCSCLNYNNKDFIEEKYKYDKMAAELGIRPITAPKPCWKSSDCQGTDLETTLITEDIKTQLANCPDVTRQIQQMEIQNSTVKDTTFSQEIDISKNVDQPTNYYSKKKSDIPEPQEESYLFLYLIIFICVIILSGLVALKFTVFDKIESKNIIDVDQY